MQNGPVLHLIVQQPHQQVQQQTRQMQQKFVPIQRLSIRIKKTLPILKPERQGNNTVLHVEN